jgi:short-subunit dehydrogenase
VALVTGASSGLGRALAVQLAAGGWRVGLIARRSEDLARVCDEIVAAGGFARYFAADVSDAPSVTRAVEFLASELGDVDLVIANAGLAPAESIRPISSADMRRMIEVNYLGVVHVLAAVLPRMVERGQGHVAAVSSLAAFRGLPSMCGYAASKAAVNTFLEGLRLELRGTGVGVSTICPGFIRTPMTARNQGPMPWLMSAEDAARRILLAVEHKRPMFAFPWPLAVAARLARHAPDWLVHWLAPREVLPPATP